MIAKYGFCGIIIAMLGLMLTSNVSIVAQEPVQPTNTAPPPITGPTHTPCAPDSPVCPPLWVPASTRLPRPAADATPTITRRPTPAAYATPTITRRPTPAAYATPTITRRPTPAAYRTPVPGPEVTNTPPPPYVRPSPTPTPGPPREYPATLDVRCWHHATRTICIATLVTNGEDVIPALYTKIGRSGTSRIINYYPLTVEVTWFDVRCGEWLGEFEIKVINAYGETPERSTEVIKHCAFIPEVNND